MSLVLDTLTTNILPLKEVWLVDSVFGSNVQLQQLERGSTFEITPLTFSSSDGLTVTEAYTIKVVAIIVQSDFAAILPELTKGVGKQMSQVILYLDGKKVYKEYGGYIRIDLLEKDKVVHDPPRNMDVQSAYTVRMTSRGERTTVRIELRGIMPAEDIDKIISEQEL